MALIAMSNDEQLVSLWLRKAYISKPRCINIKYDRLFKVQNNGLLTFADLCKMEY